MFRGRYNCSGSWRYLSLSKVIGLKKIRCNDDVGINKTEKGIVGDVAFEEVSKMKR